MAEGMDRAQSLRKETEPLPPFDTSSFLGFRVAHPVLRSMDWLEKRRSNAHLEKSIARYAREGVTSRKERYGEFFGRLLDGYWREPQGEIHVISPAHILGTDASPDPKENWHRVFAAPEASKAGYHHRMFVLLDTNQIQRDSYKNRFYVIPDSVPQSERKIKAFFIRSELFDAASLSELTEEVQRTGIPLINISSLQPLT